MLALLNSGSGPAPDRQLDGAAPARTTDGQIRQLQAQVRAAPNQPDLWAELGETYLQKVRETGDASFYTRADGVLRRALALKPDGLEGLTGAGTLALARHDFAGGLRYGLAAHRAAPGLARPLGVIVDAQVELGRYGAAASTLQRMVDLQAQPRVLRARVLLPRAPRRPARRAARDAPGGLRRRRRAREHAYVQRLLGNLSSRSATWRRPRRLPAGARAFPALRARDRRAGPRRGGGRRSEPAIRRFREAVARLPLPEYGSRWARPSRRPEGPPPRERDYALVGAEEKLLRANGVNTDVDLALYEANHGSSARAVKLAGAPGRRRPASARPTPSAGR